MDAKNIPAWAWKIWFFDIPFPDWLRDCCYSWETRQCIVSQIVAEHIGLA